MDLGLSVETLTQLHVAISLIAIGAGIGTVMSMLKAERPGWITHTFLAATALTAVTGFLIPDETITMTFGIGVATTLLLWPAFFSFYLFHLAGHARTVFAGTALAALYLNVFVLVMQLFRKVGMLNALAPTQTEVPYMIVQGAVLVGFVYLGQRVLEQFKPPAPTSA